MTTSPWARWVVGITATVGWLVCLTSLRDGGVFSRLGLYSLAVIPAVMLTDGVSVRLLLRPSRRAIFLGLGSGLLMAALTHGGYWLTTAVVPAIRPPVQHLFALFGQSPGPLAHLHWLLAIVVAEELLWRGLWPTLTEARSRAWVGSGIAVLAYAIGQAGSGSPLVVALAIGCGVVWTAQRMWTRSLWPPLLTHLVWDLIVLVWLPLE